MKINSIANMRKRSTQVRETYENRANYSVKLIVDEKKKQEKEQRETVYFFVSEIERCKAQIARLQKTGEIGDVAICLKYEGIIAEKTKAMEAKFSKTEIDAAKAVYLKDPKWDYLLNNNQR